MSPEPSPTPAFSQIDSKSSIFEKVPPAVRQQLDQALVLRQPATYRGVYEQFSLHAFGVSYTAFYCYASRVRSNAALIGLAQVTLPEGAAVSNMLPELLGHRLFEAAIDEDTSAGTLYRLAHAYRIANEAYFARRRFAVQLEDEELKAKKKETAGFLEAARQIAQCQANENFIQGHIANSIRAILDPADDSPAPIRARAEARGTPAWEGETPAEPPSISPAPIRARAEARGTPAEPPPSGHSPAPRPGPIRVAQSSALSRAAQSSALPPEAAPASRLSSAPPRTRMRDSSFSVHPSSFAHARSQVCSVDPSIHPFASSANSLPPTTTATHGLIAGPDPPTPPSRPPTLLSERRNDKRRERRRARQRRRRT
jgi:hypothetical protein